MSMEGKIRVPNFKNVLKILKGIGEEAILVFDEDGLSVRMVDGEKTKMVQSKDQRRWIQQLCMRSPI